MEKKRNLRIGRLCPERSVLCIFLIRFKLFLPLPIKKSAEAERDGENCANQEEVYDKYGESGFAILIGTVGQNAVEQGCQRCSHQAQADIG